MKKLVTAACALVAGLALADGVESANTVGYTTMAAPQGTFIIMGVQLDEVAANGARDLNALVSGVAGVNWDEDKVFTRTAAQVQIPFGAGYKTCYYLNDGWFDDGTENGDYAPGWCDGDGALVTIDLTTGVAMWVKSVSAAANVNVAGEVPADATTAVSCPAEFALRSNAYPIEVGVNDNKVTVANAADVNWDENKAFTRTATQIQIPFGAGYKTCYYLNDGWFDDGTENGDYAPGWCDGDGALVSTTIPVAQGFWTKGVSGTFTLTFAK